MAKGIERADGLSKGIRNLNMPDCISIKMDKKCNKVRMDARVQQPLHVEAYRWLEAFLYIGRTSTP